MESAKISVVMCTYNGEKFVSEQIDSILAQTFPPLEIIIQDDNSTDQTWNILTEYAQKHPSVRIFRNENGKGVNANFYSAMQRATGDYIAISDQDDRWEADKQEKQIQRIGDNALCGGFSRPFSTEGLPLHFDSRLPNFELLRLLYINPVSGHTQMFRRELIDKIPYDSLYLELRYYDAILMLLAQAEGGVTFVEDVLVNHRRHGSSMTYTKPKDNKLTLNNIFRNVHRTWKLYQELKPEMKRRLNEARLFLESTGIRNKAVENAKKLCRLQQDTSLFGVMRMSLFCAKHKTELFYTREDKGIVILLRALYFPVSSSEYFGYLSKDFKRF